MPRALRFVLEADEEGVIPSDSMPKLAIEVRGLRKSYGQSAAVDGIDLSVAEGEIFGLLGPNGAGITSTIEILEGIRARSGGEARVLGLDPTNQSAALKHRIGVSLQSTNLPDRIRVAIMDRGRIVAEGSPCEIQECTLAKALVEARLSAESPAAFSLERREGDRGLSLRTNEPGECLAQLVRWCDGHGLRLDDASVRRASLEDAFIALTGHRLPDA